MKSVCGWITSFLSACFGFATQSNVAWFVSVLAGLVAIWAGVMTIKEKRMSIRQMKKHNSF